jgi:hypothetical protein
MEKQSPWFRFSPLKFARLDSEKSPTRVKWKAFLLIELCSVWRLFQPLLDQLCDASINFIERLLIFFRSPQIFKIREDGAVIDAHAAKMLAGHGIDEHCSLKIVNPFL